MRKVDDYDAAGGGGARRDCAAAGFQTPSCETRHDRARWVMDHVMPHENWLKRWLQRHGHEQDAEDIVQESYAMLFRVERVDHVHHPRNYLCQTARSIILQRARRDSVIRFECFADPTDCLYAAEAPLQDEAIAAREELALVMASLDRLPPRTRDVFRLRRLEGYSSRETAERLGVSQSAVEKHLHCAVRQLLQLCGRAELA